MSDALELLQRIIADSKRGSEIPNIAELTNDDYIFVFVPGSGFKKIKKGDIVFPGEPITKLTGLSDTPSQTLGQAGKILVVNETEDGFIYRAINDIEGVTQQELNNALANYIKTISVNGGTLQTPDAAGNVNLTIDSQGSPLPPVDETYADVTALLADQNNQEQDYFYEVTDASGLTSISSGAAVLLYNASTPTGTEGDYIIIWSEEDLSGLTEEDVKNTKRLFTAQQGFAEQELTDAATLSWDLDTQQTARLLATSAVGNTRLLPASILTKAEPGVSYQLTFKQDATGGRTIDLSEFNEVYGDFNLEPNGVSTISLWQSQGVSFVTITSKASALEEAEIQIIKKLDIFSATAENAIAPLALPSYDGTTQGTHPSVVYFKTPWNGYNYWMVYTPYPNANDDFENPCILASNDKKNWVVPQGLTNPIEPEPLDGTYYADTHLVYDEANDRLICYWRGFAPGLTEFYVLAKTSSDGVNWGAKTTVCTLTNGGGSPVILKNGNNFELYSIDFLTGTTHTINRIVSSNPLSFDYANSEELNYSGLPEGQEIWHFDIYNLNGICYCLMTTTAQGTNGTAGDLYFGIIENDNFKFIDYPFLERESGWTQNRLYRGCIVPEEITEEGIIWNLWYGAVNSSNSWNIGFTELSTFYPGMKPEFLPKYVKKNIDIHDFHDGKTLVIQGDVTITIPQGLKKHFSAIYDVLLNSNLAANPASGISFSGYQPAVGNQLGKFYQLSKDIYRFVKFATASGGSGGTTTPEMSVLEAQSEALPVNPTGFVMNPEGTKVFLSDIATDEIRVFVLSTAFDVTTIATTQLQAVSVVYETSSPLNVWINGAGTQMLVASNSPKSIIRYELSTPYDVTTAIFSEETAFTYPAEQRGFQFGDGGNKLFLSAITSNTIYQYILTTPYDLDTAELDVAYTSSTGSAGFPSIYMSNDGKTLVGLDTNNKCLRLIRLDTPYNLTTAITEQTLAIGADTYNGVYFNADETECFIMNYTTRKIEKRRINLNGSIPV